MPNTDCEKINKKINKKQRRSQNIVEKELGLKCCNHPTNILVICNAGLINGLTQEKIYENFIVYGRLERIVMIPGKSCCMVVYTDVNNAQNAYDNLNGKLCIAQDDKPIFLSYTESVLSENCTNFNEKPPGLIILEEFVTEEEENRLIEIVNFQESNPTMKHRQVKHFGYEFLYTINNVDLTKPLDGKIPSVCDKFWDKLHKFNINFHPDQLTVNKYEPGQGIPPHVDTHSAFEDKIASLSLLSDVIMEFKHRDGRSLSVNLPRRSLMIMQDEARYDWIHAITPRKLDFVSTTNGLTSRARETRVSFTFRKTLDGECHCKYPEMCDSYAKTKSQQEIADSDAQRLERLHVHSVYENIADHFSDTRHKPWPNVAKFIQNLPPASILLDLGCGNGKYLTENLSLFNIGCDTSMQLLNVCKQRNYEIFSCNCLQIPLRDGVVDGVICIAVIHHLANEKRRLRAIKEILRILKVSGRALIYIWAKDQTVNNKSSYLMQDRKNRKENSKLVDQATIKSVTLGDNVSLPVHTNRKQFLHQDMLVPWKLKQDVQETNAAEFLRYYHVFEEGELEQLCLQFDNLKIIESYYDQGNWCVSFEKTL